MSKHTKGRWVVGKSIDDGRNFAINVVDEDCDNDDEHAWTEMATVYTHNRKESKANAILIAAAPTLLQAIVDAEKELGQVLKYIDKSSRLEDLRSNLLKIIETLDH